MIPNPTAGRFCPLCGKPNRADVRHCTSCGGRLGFRMNPALVIGGALAAVAVAVGIVWWTNRDKPDAKPSPEAVERRNRAKCQANLSNLIRAAYNYCVTKTAIEGSFHDHLDGKAWILWLQRMGEVTDPAVFRCPSAPDPGPGGTSYRGYKNNGNPNGTVNQCPGDMPVMSCDNHPDVGIYAVKAGSVHECPKNSPKWTGTGVTDVRANCVD